MTDKSTKIELINIKSNIISICNYKKRIINVSAQDADENGLETKEAGEQNV